MQRYFDGTAWTEHQAPNMQPLSDYERTMRLDDFLTHEVAMGATVAARTRHQAVIVTGSAVSGAGHAVFAILTVFSCGLFLIPWVIVAMYNTVRRTTISIDLYGNIVKD